MSPCASRPWPQVTLKTIREKCAEYTSRAEALKKGVDNPKGKAKAAGGKEEDKEEDSEDDDGEGGSAEGAGRGPAARSLAQEQLPLSCAANSSTAFMIPARSSAEMEMLSSASTQ